MKNRKSPSVTSSDTRYREDPSTAEDSGRHDVNITHGPAQPTTVLCSRSAASAASPANHRRLEESQLRKCCAHRQVLSLHAAAPQPAGLCACQPESACSSVVSVQRGPALAIRFWWRHHGRHARRARASHHRRDRWHFPPPFERNDCVDDITLNLRRGFIGLTLVLFIFFKFWPRPFALRLLSRPSSRVAVVSKAPGRVSSILH